MNNQLITSQQCVLAAKNGESIQGYARECCQQALLSTGKPQLWCWVQVWTPKYKTDMDIQEQVQQKTMKIMTEASDTQGDAESTAMLCLEKVQGEWGEDMSYQCV